METEYHLARGTNFARVGIALALGGDYRNAHEIACKRWGRESGAAQVLRAAVAGAGSGSGEWGAELAGTRLAAAEFLEAIHPATILGKLAGIRRVPVRTPFVALSTNAVAYWRAEGGAAPLSAGAFARDTMEPLSLAALMVLSNDLLEDSSPEAEALVRRDMADAVVQLSDESFVDPSNTGVAGKMPAAVTNGITPINSAGDLANDCEAAVEAFTGNFERASWILHPKTAVQAGIRAGGRGVAADLGGRGGTLGGLPAIVSASVPHDSTGGLLVLVDGGDIVLCDDGVQVKRSTQATVEMADNPTGETLGPTSGTSLVSLFQAESTGLLVTRRINWQTARSGTVVVVQNCSYAS